ncbi:capsid protein [Hortaea werneckii totivirus 1]|nr:capsid protein [Hortaea werneckii totivirus 1]
MFSKFLRDFMSFRFDENFSPVFSQGHFSLTNSTTVTIKHGNLVTNSNLESTSDFEICGTHYETYREGMTTDYNGYNARYIRDDGTFDPVSAADEFSKRSVEKKFYRDEQLAFMLKHTISDSHESFIFNMLVSWYKSILYNMCNGADDTFTVNYSPYHDSHVEIPHFGNVTNGTEDIELDFPVDDERLTEQVNLMEVRHRENYFSKPYVFYHSSQAKGQAEFYYSHLAGRKKSSQLNVDVDLPGVDCSQLLIDMVGGGTAIQADFDQIPWSKSETIWEWIIDYVRLNRVEHAFAAAFETMGYMVTTPMGSYQESQMWNGTVMKLHMAAFSPTRARFKNTLEGDAYVESTAPYDFVIAESPSPKDFLVYASMMNYASWMGLYIALDDYSRVLDDWRNAFVASNDNTRVLMTPFGKAAMASIVLGKEVPTMANRSCWISTNLSRVGEVRVVESSKVIQAGHRARFDTTKLHPYVSGSLFLGSVVKDFPQYRHLSASNNVYVNDNLTLEQEEALVLANAYRMAGHEIVALDPVSRREFQSYANVRECVVDPTPYLNLTIDTSPIILTDSQMREGRSYPLPHVKTLLDSTVEVAINRPTIGASEYRRAARVLRNAVKIKRQRRDMHFRVSAPHMADFKRNFSFQKPGKQDFRSEEVHQAPGLTQASARMERPLQAEAAEPLAEDVG